MKIGTYLLEQLLAFKESKTLTEAADRLHLTQPTLTRSMKKLEDIFGVPLFLHDKNRLYLNENGMLAAEYARDILSLQDKMIGQVRTLDRVSKTICVGSCAPGPILELMPLFTSSFPHLTISTEIREEEMLLQGLREHIYQLVLLARPLGEDALFSVKCSSEALCVSLIPEHRFAQRTAVHFADLNGESFLMASEVGIWDKVVRKMLPDSKFLLQDGTDALMEVVLNSSLPSFATDVTLRIAGVQPGPGPRIFIPFSDPEAHLDYYCVCLSEEKTRFKNLFRILNSRAS